MKGVNSDVWVLTETWTDFEPFGGYERIAFSSDAADLGAKSKRCWVSIWAKPDLRGVQLDDYGSTDRMTCARFSNSPLGDMVVIGTVLPWRSDSLFRGAKGFCRAIDDQAKDWKQIALKHRDATMVVAGDFNQSLPYVNRYGTKEGAAALERAIEDVGLSCTTRGIDDSTEQTRIDHICIGHNNRKRAVMPQAKSWEVPILGSRPVSDHIGAFVDLDSSWFDVEA